MQDGTGRRYGGRIAGGDDLDPNRWTARASMRDQGLQLSRTPAEHLNDALVRFLGRPSDFTIEMGHLSEGGQEIEEFKIRWRIGPSTRQ